jgi:long-chain acyl-CoA synthetase
MSFIDTMYRKLDEGGNAPAIIEMRGKQPIPTSAAQLKQLTARVRGYLESRKIQAGDRVALIAHNGARWAAADLAILGAGAICVPMYDRQAAEELAGMLANAEVSLVLVDSAKLKGSLEGAGVAGDKIALFDQVFEHASSESGLVKREGSDRVTMIYTSGTSGEPKGVLYTVDNVGFMLERTIERLGEMKRGRTTADRVFHYLPFCFAGSRIQLWSQLYRGNPLMVSTNLENLVEELGAADPHYVLNVPALLERLKTGVGNKLKTRGGLIYQAYKLALAAHEKSLKGALEPLDHWLLLAAKKVLFPRIKQQIGKNLEFLICGSAPLSEDTQRWFQMIGIPVYQVYGLTETTAIVTMDRKGVVRPGYVGRAIDGVEVKITDEGELVCRGPNIFPEYWKRPDATAKAIRNGWFHSGDVAELTPEGDVRIVGRLKDLLVPESGHNVAPGPIEEKVVAYLEGAAQAMVVGHARPYLSVIVTGAVEQDALQKAIDQVNAELPHYRRLRRFFIAPEPFSIENGLLTANQKLKRAAVEKRYASEISGMYQ